MRAFGVELGKTLRSPVMMLCGPVTGRKIQVMRRFLRAHKEGRILVTLDKDFGELAIVHEMPHSGIIRLVNLAAREQGVVCLRIIDIYGNELQSGAIVTAEPGRLRIRPPDGKLEEE